MPLFFALNEKTFEIPFIWESLDDKEKIMIFLHLAKLVTPKPTIQSQKNENFKLMKYLFFNHSLIFL